MALEWLEKVRAGRVKMRQACIDTALANTPSSVRVIYMRKNLSGSTSAPTHIRAPKPVTRRALHIFLHECAHVALEHVGPNARRKPRHVEEYEAERWAFERMKEAGIAVPRKSLARAKAYVERKIRQAKVRGAKKIDKAALQWSARSKQ